MKTNKKQPKIDKTIPVEFSTLPQDNSLLKLVLVQRVDGEWFKFADSTSAKCGFTSDNVARSYHSWEQFDQDATVQQVDSLILSLFGEKIMKQLEKNKRVTDQDKTLAVWRKLTLIATDRLQKPAALNVDPVSGKKVRKSSLSTRTYTLLTTDTTSKTPQILALLKILSESVDEQKHVTEEELKKIIVARAEELKTKQDPWRIFQYYRPQLIAAKNLVHD